MADPPVLHLFTSNQRPLYEQDVLDVLAKDVGAIHRFRYRAEHLPDDLVRVWDDSDLVNREIVLIFSVQQQLGYHQAAYVPFRKARVRRMVKQGSLFVVEFTLGTYVAIPRNDDDRPGAHVLRFSQRLREHLEHHPDADPPKSVALGEGLSQEFVTGTTAWELAVDDLAHTLSFQNAVFLRQSHLREVGTDSTLEPDGSGIVELAAGHSYELGLTYEREFDLSRVLHYTVDADEGIVSIVGNTQLTLGTGFDHLGVVLHAADRTEVRETILEIRPGESTQGAVLRLHVRVVPDARQEMVSAVGLVAASFPGLIAVGLPWAVPLFVAIVLVLIGSIAIRHRGRLFHRSP